VEEGPDGVAVWVGLDGADAALAASAPALLAALRREVQLVPERLRMLVCNGRAIYVDADAPRATGPFSSKEES
jgi:hypothetical protein